MRRWLITTVATALVGMIVKKLTSGDDEKTRKGRRR
ncbi:hypothetical protein L332_00780 [Agrococcus pavilionensis RW1]|uniref:Uncharacterized protein n=1 Tax=Agrococcus pavilionensis RW1 TaxID=1330458 RepID=U1LM47_9MICO|nr:hypothetical protein L332_00780 [Agrococcus pavilionensis RW1]